jgi:hypothetical protein
MRKEPFDDRWVRGMAISHDSANPVPDVSTNKIPELKETDKNTTIIIIMHTITCMVSIVVAFEYTKYEPSELPTRDLHLTRWE